jgi:hypothetical protein
MLWVYGDGANAGTVLIYQKGIVVDTVTLNQANLAIFEHP